MDIFIFIAIVSVGMLLAVIALVMLNRAWGDFPGRISQMPINQPSVQMPPSRGFDAPAPTDDGSDAELPAGTPDESMILITHPLVRRSVAQALERGGTPYAAYFVRDGERIYLAAYRISDPQQRAIAVRTFNALNSNNPTDISITDVVRMIGQLGR